MDANLEKCSDLNRNISAVVEVAHLQPLPMQKQVESIIYRQLQCTGKTNP